MQADPPPSIDAAPAARRWGPLFVAATCFAAVVAVAYAVLACMGLPGYGTWTGIRPLENKTAQLEEFCAHGGVDALALGSSIVDFGFSAELFSRLMAQHTGHEYRVFNFATGGAEPRTLPKLYRFARTVCRPRAIFVIAPAEQHLREEISKGSPDHTLAGAPVGPAIGNQRLLELDKALWGLPILKYAPAARDLFLFGGYRNLRAGMDSYEVNGHGDRLSYLMMWKLRDLPEQKSSNEIYVRPFRPGTPAAHGVRTAAEYYFANIDRAGMHELRDLARQDGARIYLLTHAGAATLWDGGAATSPGYARGRREFYETFAAELGATLVDVDGHVEVPWYAISDVTHLNTYGARMYTRAAFGVFAGRPDDPATRASNVAMDPPPETLFPTNDHSFNQYAALLRRPAGGADPLLRFRMVDSSDVPPLPEEELFAALRTPDDRDIIAPAIAIGPHEFVAEVDLPPTAHPEGFVLRLVYDDGSGKVAAMNTLADYEWVSSFPTRPLGIRRGPQPPVIAWPPLRKPGDAIYVGLRRDVPLPAKVSLDLAPAAGMATAARPVELGTHAPERGGLMKVALPAKLEPGDYALRVRDAANGTLVADTPIEITRTGSARGPSLIGIAAPARIADGYMTVRWSDIPHPRTKDWIGLFPVGAGPGGRLDMAFTDARAAGEMRFPINRSIAPRLASGRFELRLYGGGGWQMLARSEAFAFEVPPGMPAAVAAAGVSDPTPTATQPHVYSERTPQLGAASVRVGWAGIRAPSEQDWVGLFPAGGSEQSRLDFVFTKGLATGQIDFPISSAIADRLGSGKYEFRLFSAGGWKQLARSEPVEFSRAR